MEKVNLPTVIPEQLAAASESFVEFIKAYYDFMNKEGMPSELLNKSLLRRDAYTATDTFLDVLYSELGHEWIDNRDNDRAKIISNLNNIYKTRGSIDSIKVLFRAVFGEEVEVKLPKEFILKPSSGTWLQDYSIICKLDDGDPYKLVGNFVKVATFFPGSPEQVFDVEIKRIEQRDINNGIYQLFISRYYVGFFYEGSTIEYQDVKMSLLQSLSKTVGVPVGGSGFRIGDTYDIVERERNGVYDYIQGLSEPFRTTYYNAVGKLLEEKNIQRWYLADTRYNRNKLESVSKQSYTNGTTVETVTRDDVTKIVVDRGTQRTTQFTYINGTISTRTDPTDGQVSPNILVNWDSIIQQMIDYLINNTLSLFSQFINDTPPGESFIYGDISNTGSITIDDIIAVARRSLGLSISAEKLAWIDDILIPELMLRNLNTPLNTTSAAGAKVRVIETDENGGILAVRITSFGYNYPKVLVTYVEPYDENGDYAEVVLSSESIGVSLAEYVDRKGFLSDIIKIHDNDYYQEFSYVVESTLNPTVASDAVLKTVHPAGMKIFADQVITEDFFVGNLTQESEHHTATAIDASNLFNHLVYELAELSESIAKYYDKPLTESLTLVDAIAKDYFPGTKNEAINITDSAATVQEALYVESGYFYDDFDYVTHWLAATPIT